MAALALVAGFLLPNRPITRASIQTLAAPVAFLKDCLYLFPMFIIFAIPTYHLVISLEGEMKSGRAKAVVRLLKGGKVGVTPRSAIYLKPIVLGTLFVIVIAVALHLMSNILDNLVYTPEAWLFQLLLWLRIGLFAVWGVEILLWYKLALERIMGTAAEATAC